MSAARLGVLLPTFDPLRVGATSHLLPAARLVERLGFDAAWAGDHLRCPAPGLDAPTALAAVAAVTSKLQLGFSVMLLGLRQPAWTAKQLVTLDALSHGRLVLGVGVGGEFPQEFAAAGVPIATRGKRLDETLSVMTDLLLGRQVHHDGGALQVHAPALEPAMAAPPPIFIGGRSEAALARAARYGDAWLPMWLTPETIAARAERLYQLADEHERPRPKLALLVGVHVDESLQRARHGADDYVRGQYGLELQRVARWTLIGPAEQVAQQLAGYCAAGVEEFVLMPLAADQLAQIERLADVRERLRAREPHILRAVSADLSASGQPTASS